ncbi:hypothetical protein LRS11_10570 [Pseudomonas sp. J452]|uniref:DUF6882 domain-containing protein n=1 Tax=Pseudomonas sp. J452 TaxID=2898441 RepID=UPI0021ADDE88|nr:DUF6882 domain-containing protein [Pseudomonas sp. J452]UUY10437.1 hypothetical protein LRS11_10570 [Pseudomonas sp. J452]
MSDEERNVECGVHGSNTATFICQHLQSGEGQGFNVAYDPEQPDDLYPDAWCDQCDAVLEQEGEWNDRAEAFADICVVCAECYCQSRERNWHEDEEVLHALIAESFDYLQAQQDSFMATYRIGEHKRWDWYQETGQLIFSNDGKPAVECAVDFVGTFSSHSDTWMWAWANESFLELVKARSRVVRELGESLDFLKLACATWSADPVDGWEMTAVMAHQLGAIGSYRAPSERGFLYMVVREARWVS